MFDGSAHHGDVSVKKESPAITAIRAQIQRIAFDANIWDKGIGDYPYAEKCSKKRKLLLAEIDRLQGRVVEAPKKARKTKFEAKKRLPQGQLELFPISDTSRKRKKP